MFTIHVTVPRITSAQVAEFESAIPGFLTVATVPVIETEEQAIREGKVVGNKQLASREFISTKDTVVTPTATGWDIKFLCFGD